MASQLRTEGARRSRQAPAVAFADAASVFASWRPGVVALDLGPAGLGDVRLVLDRPLVEGVR